MTVLQFQSLPNRNTHISFPTLELGHNIGFHKTHIRIVSNVSHPLERVPIEPLPAESLSALHALNTSAHTTVNLWIRGTSDKCHFSVHTRDQEYYE